MNELLWWINSGNQNVVRPDRNRWLLKKPSFLVSSPSLNWLLCARHRILLPTVACLAAASLQTADCLKEAREWAAILLVIFLFCFVLELVSKTDILHQLRLRSVTTPAIRSLPHKMYISARCCSTMCITNGNSKSRIHPPLDEIARHQKHTTSICMEVFTSKLHANSLRVQRQSAKQQISRLALLPVWLLGFS